MLIRRKILLASAGQRINYKDFGRASSIFLFVIVLIQSILIHSALASEFDAFFAEVWPLAKAQNVSRATFDSATAGLTPDPAILKRPSRQGEFSMKISDYVANSVSSGRIAQGRKMAQAYGDVLTRLERETGVPGQILLAFWAVESNFGSNQGSSDVLRALATHAIRSADRAEMFRDEFVAALVMLENGYARRDQLKGSWAGAMGQPQFLPSAYLKFAQAYAGGQAADIWSNPRDVLSSIANFMKLSGWTAHLPAVIEVKAPDNFDWEPLDLDFSQWRARGFSRADGGALPASGAASIYPPEGADGPIFLITDNWEVIRQYNTSDAYALSVALLAQGIGGGRLRQSFRQQAESVTQADRVFAQRALSREGFYDGKTDGKFGRKTRVAIHAYQRAHGISPADGYLSKTVLLRLRNQ